jgi:Eco57I restriction-modification methylase
MLRRSKGFWTSQDSSKKGNQMADSKTQSFSFESFRQRVEELSLEMFVELGGASIDAVSRHLLFNDILILIFSALVRGRARRSNRSTVHLARSETGLDSLSLIKREELVIKRLKRAFGARATVALQILAADPAISTSLFPNESVGMLFELMYGAIPKFVASGNPRLLGSHERRDRGVYFTPIEVVRFVAKSTLQPKLAKTRNAQEILAIRIVDPALGAGFFLLESLRLLSDRYFQLSDELSTTRVRRSIAERCLYGVDIDQMATDIAKALLWLEVGDLDFPGSCLDAHITHGDALLGPAIAQAEQRKSKSSPIEDDVPNSGQDNEQVRQLLNNKADRNTNRSRNTPFSWALNFPEVFLSGGNSCGFDIVLSNPPWGKVKPDLKEFYSHFDSAVSQYQGDALKRYVNGQTTQSLAASIDRLWKNYAQEIKTYSTILQDLDVFQHQRAEINGRTTRGDSDLYKYFMERCFQIVKHNGRVGLVIPAAFHRSEGAAGLRKLYWNHGRFETYLEFENRKNIFPIHGMFRFVLLTYQRGGKPGIQAARFGLTTVKDAQTIEYNNTIAISTSFLKRVGGDSLTVPEIRSKLEQRLLIKLYSGYPTLGKKSSIDWNACFVRELDMTKDSGAFIDRVQLMKAGCTENVDGSWSSPAGVNYLPLYEGRMVNQFDNAAKAYKGGQGRTAQWVPLPFSNKAIVPHYFVADAYIEKYDLLNAPARAAFCDVTGHANERTVLSALIPKGVPCGNKVPTLCFDKEDPRLHLIWLALANSFVIDWLVRRRVSTTLNFFHWYSIPFPRVSPNSEVGIQLTKAARILCDVAVSNDSKNKTIDYKELLRRRSNVRARIDAIVAELFELTLPEYVLVLNDFQIIDRYQRPLPTANGVEARSTITRDKALCAFLQRSGGYAAADEFLALKDDSSVRVKDVAQRVLLAEVNGAVGYVPSEHAAVI